MNSYSLLFLSSFLLVGCNTASPRLLNEIGLNALQDWYETKDWATCSNGMSVYNAYLCNYEYDYPSPPKTVKPENTTG